MLALSNEGREISPSRTFENLSKHENLTTIFINIPNKKCDRCPRRIVRASRYVRRWGGEGLDLCRYCYLAQGRAEIINRARRALGGWKEAA